MTALKKELGKYIVSGCAAVAVDFVGYYLLLNYLNENVAKGISFVMGTVVAFLLNKYWTFEKKEKSVSEIIKFALLYTCTWTANVYTNKIVLDYTHWVFLAFLIATGVSTVLNFVGQKWWVFKN